MGPFFFFFLAAPVTFWILVLPSRTEPVPSAVDTGMLNTGPPEKSPNVTLHSNDPMGKSDTSTIER